MVWTLCAVGLLTAIGIAMIAWGNPLEHHTGWFGDWTWSGSEDDSGAGWFDCFSSDSGECGDWGSSD